MAFICMTLGVVSNAFTLYGAQVDGSHHKFQRTCYRFCSCEATQQVIILANPQRRDGLTRFTIVNRSSYLNKAAILYWRINQVSHVSAIMLA